MNTSFLPPKNIGVLRGSPLFPHIEHYVTLLREQGYATDTVVSHVYLFRHFRRWLERRRFVLEEVNEKVLDNFLERCRYRQRDSHDGAPQALRRLLGILRSAGATPPAEPISRTPAQRLVEEYRIFLHVERGLVAKTVKNYTRYVEQFLTKRFGAGDADLSQLKLTEVIGFVQRTARERNQIYTKCMAIALRSFLRYLQYRGKIETNWAASVPVVAHWRLSGLPKCLPSKTVERILDECDQATALGRRDHAILLLLARLGLRGGEVVRMQLEDIDWETGQLTVRSKKGRGWARMPLPSDVGRAIARYLRHDRPTCACRNVFVRIAAPYAPLNNSAVIGLRVRAMIKRAGIETARKGSHVFRHSLASEMLRHGSTLDEIGQVLRHHDHDTTAIYAKVDLNALRRLTVPLPGGAA
jgi:site-specific recombinase XerD